MSGVTILPIRGIPEVRKGDDISRMIVEAAGSDPGIVAGDVVVVTQKIVSKSEGRVVHLADVTPSPEAERLAAQTEKDPRLVELILQESAEIVRAARPDPDHPDQARLRVRQRGNRRLQRWARRHRVPAAPKTPMPQRGASARPLAGPPASTSR